ncbi:MAG: glyoxalase [Anaerolineae bacterium]|nr:glyoxalase [Anaerolineae bacterium]
MKVLGAHHVQLSAPPGCEPDARAFYVGVLGLEEIAKPRELRHQGGIWLRTPQLDIHISPRVDDTLPGPHRHLALRVVDIEAWRIKLQIAGVRIEAAEDVAGWARFFCFDPFSNKLELLEVLA